MPTEGALKATSRHNGTCATSQKHRMLNMKKSTDKKTTMKMTETLKVWWNDHKEQSLKNEANAINADFKVCEKDGKIYLTHHGYAFAVMSKDATAAAIAAKLNEARKAALGFGGL